MGPEASAVPWLEVERGTGWGLVKTGLRFERETGGRCQVCGEAKLMGGLGMMRLQLDGLTRFVGFYGDTVACLFTT